MSSEQIIKRANEQLRRTDMFIDYYSLVEENKKLSNERLNELLEFFIIEEKYNWCAIIKFELDESLDN